MKRTVEYDGWTIEASPTILVKQRLFKSGVGISRGNLYFFFHDLGNRVYRAQAYERGIEWAKQWIDNNWRYGSSHLTQEQAMSKYSDKLFALCDEADRLTGTGGGRALRKIIMDLESDGPIGELMFTLDDKRFNQVIELLVEFRHSGRHERFNALHEEARERASPKGVDDVH
jgi:hypothetical protein